MFVQKHTRNRSELGICCHDLRHPRDAIRIICSLTEVPKKKKKRSVTGEINPEVSVARQNASAMSWKAVPLGISTPEELLKIATHSKPGHCDFGCPPKAKWEASTECQRKRRTHSQTTSQSAHQHSRCSPIAPRLP